MSDAGAPDFAGLNANYKLAAGASQLAQAENRGQQEYSSVDPVEFLKAVIRPIGGAIELRVMRDNAVVARAFCRTTV